ncbi:unnamed protein product [Enterobius vermicularis]|uniref:Bestrophin homolog n=1 Tax=Enterobius vermicularis TaxID=51028 RepID=A0A0N4VGS9_ENTVE|nr:unnamed protein product [Enterobius vermicularis]
MTVSYNADVSSASFWSFVKIMLRWRGSVWKMIYFELVLWCTTFTIFSLIYRLGLDKNQQILFEKICLLCNKYGDLLPVTFMLGFYVSLVVTRWQSFWKNVGWVDSAALSVATYIAGYDERSLMIRRTIMRYLCCMQVLVFRSISKPVKKRFPTLESMVKAG